MDDSGRIELDGRLLQALVAVHEEGSLTRAAQRLGLTQSAVSHAVERLRAITGDALFVRSGRGIVPTARADALVASARRLLAELRDFGRAGDFDPAQLRRTLTIAANDLQRDLLLPPLLARLRAQAPGVLLRVIPAGAPTPELLRDEACALALTPRPPEAGDILQRRLFDDEYRVFFDPQARQAPRDQADYLAAEHLTVAHDGRLRTLDIDDRIAGLGLQRRIVATVPVFAGLAALLAGSTRLATAPGRLRHGVLRGLADAPLPWLHPAPGLTMYMVWHQRHQDDPMHRWLRELLVACAGAAAPQRSASPPPPSTL
ncbi:LysR family transcriptional regulator (plasmid) [Sphaerotilus natans]|uniref:LysR family transcriptional regulator n=1 Tax=Sphaerotilus natans TaxID=34103 RepID=UPI00406C25BB